jgi:stress-induced morphogen
MKESDPFMALIYSEEKIREKIQEALHPVHLEVIDESRQHAGHREGSADGGTHFNCLCVSEAFEGKSLIERHRRIYEILAQPLEQGVHALALKTLTPGEWQKLS